MADPTQAYCACRKVECRPRHNEDGTLTDAWVCAVCERAFAPIPVSPKWPDMSSGSVSGTMPPGTLAFNASTPPRPAIEAALTAFGNAEVDCGAWNEGDDEGPDEHFPHPYKHYYDIAVAARQAVLDAHEAALGEEYVVKCVNRGPYDKDTVGVALSTGYEEGDRVRVSKVEPDKSVEGTP